MRILIAVYAMGMSCLPIGCAWYEVESRLDRKASGNNCCGICRGHVYASLSGVDGVVCRVVLTDRPMIILVVVHVWGDVLPR